MQQDRVLEALPPKLMVPIDYRYPFVALSLLVDSASTALCVFNLS